MMEINYFEIIMVAGAALYAKDNRMQNAMLALTFCVIALDKGMVNTAPNLSITPWYELYYVLMTTVLVAFAGIFAMIRNTFAYLFAIVISVNAMINLLMVFDLSGVYFIHEAFSVNIVLVEVALAWVAAVKSRNG